MAANSTTVTVLAPNGRRQTVKVFQSMPLLQVLEEVCNKQNFSAKEYDLKFQRTVVDLSKQWRFANLPNNAKLEMVPSSQQRVGLDSMVRIALQLEDGSRLQGSFLCGQTLWDLIDYFPHTRIVELQLMEFTPVCIYMRDEIVGDEGLKKTTLKSLGLTGGSAIIRYLKRKKEVSTSSIPGEISADDGCSDKIYAQSSVETSNISSCGPPQSLKDEDASTEKLSFALDNPIQMERASTTNQVKIQNQEYVATKTATVHLEDEAVILAKYKQTEDSHAPPHETTDAEDSSLLTPEKTNFVPFSGGGQRLGGLECKYDEGEGGVSPSRSLTSISSSGSPPKAKKIRTIAEKVPETSKSEQAQHEEMHMVPEEELFKSVDRMVVVYHMDDEKQHPKKMSVLDDLPDEFFEITVDDVRKRFAQLKSERQLLEEAPLLTKATKESKMREKLIRYPKIIVRVQFPDRHVLQGFFRPLETVGALEEFIKEHLNNQGLSFYLFVAPPKLVLDDPTATLFKANLFPAALVYFGSSAKPDYYLKKELLDSAVTPFEADDLIASCIPRSPTQSSSSLASEATILPVLETDLEASAQNSTTDNSHPNGLASKPNATDSNKMPKWLKLPVSSTETGYKEFIVDGEGSRSCGYNLASNYWKLDGLSKSPRSRPSQFMVQTRVAIEPCAATPLNDIQDALKDERPPSGNTGSIDFKSVYFV
ncbi:tether containing UBX domain for GLUT4 [Polypterus senegalus]|uniref:tether containing UBX domain for GLUT4 n=1 Tax=Polypterus senegalus TaxID=55291 RepID=UPI0019638F7D|nr:tether containing UBX domain for GLUT4 [Polypterus senegalus]